MEEETITPEEMKALEQYAFYPGFAGGVPGLSTPTIPSEVLDKITTKVFEDAIKSIRESLRAFKIREDDVEKVITLFKALANPNTIFSNFNERDMNLFLLDADDAIFRYLLKLRRKYGLGREEIDLLVLSVVGNLEATFRRALEGFSSFFAQPALASSPKYLPKEKKGWGWFRR